LIESDKLKNLHPHKDYVNLNLTIAFISTENIKFNVSFHPKAIVRVNATEIVGT